LHILTYRKPLLSRGRFAEP